MVVWRARFSTLVVLFVCGCAGQAATSPHAPDAQDAPDASEVVFTPPGDSDVEPCDEIGATRSCGEAIGTCSQGQATCVSLGEFGGTWSECRGATGPRGEACDTSADEDCDGAIDEGCADDGGEDDAEGPPIGTLDAAVPATDDARPADDDGGLDVPGDAATPSEDPPIDDCPYAEDPPPATGRGQWRNFQNQAPSPRANHAAVWTGEEMIVWGGYRRSYLDDGAIYSPRTRTWRQMTGEGAPSARATKGVWTGREMIVFGGRGDLSTVGGGAAYDPTRDRWTPLPRVCLPPYEYDVSWTGTHVLVESPVGGALYDPATRTWELTSRDGAHAYDGASYVWTGEQLIAWGGYRYVGAREEHAREGSLYDLATDTWTAISTEGAPAATFGHRAVWTGSKMIVWGGSRADGSQPTEGGAIYDPATDTWTALPSEGAPSSYNAHEAIWTGHEMLVHGSPHTRGLPGTALFDPETGRWTVLDEPPAQGSFRPSRFSLVWTGEEAIFFGGYALGSGDFFSNMGATLDPETRVWTALPVSTAQPRIRHASAFGGDRMFVWGGVDPEGHALATGDVIDVEGERATPMTTVGAPSARQDATAVWTGAELIVWGGDLLATGGVYDPGSDSWRPTSTSGAPTGRTAHAAAWTGREMIVWGGRGGTGALADGAAYDPARDTWRPLSRDGAPPARLYSNHAVWTGDKLVIWGIGEPALTSGAIYHPETDRWEAIATEGSPGIQTVQALVAAGSKLFVWSMGSGYGSTTSGAIYDLETRTWTAVPPAPAQYFAAVATWTGREVILWGGASPAPAVTRALAFDPSTMTWTSLEPRGQFRLRYAFGGYSGGKLHVWGGWGLERRPDSNHSMLGASLDLAAD